MTVKKFIKCFVPYGILSLKRRVKAFKYIKNVKGNEEEYSLCDTTIKIIATNNIVQICRADYKYPIYLRNSTIDVGVYREICEKKEYDFCCKEEPKYIIDAGANIGMASIYFANKYKEAKIIAIEPEEENYKLLKLNTEKYSNITVINAALWNASGEIELFDVGVENVGFMIETDVSSIRLATKNFKQLTKTITIDEIIHDFNIDNIDILKIDIEGAEKELFESCENWINKVKLIIAELHERKKKGCNKAFYKNSKLFDVIGMRSEDVYLSKNYIEMVE